MSRTVFALIAAFAIAFAATAPSTAWAGKGGTESLGGYHTETASNDGFSGKASGSGRSCRAAPPVARHWRHKCRNLRPAVWRLWDKPSRPLRAPSSTRIVRVAAIGSLQNLLRLCWIS